MPGENPGENEPKAFFRRTLVVEAAGSGVAEVCRRPHLPRNPSVVAQGGCGSGALS